MKRNTHKLTSNTLTVAALERLLQVMKEHGKDAVIDWDNLSIQVLGDPTENPAVIMSDGKPLKSWPILIEFKGSL